MSSRPRTRSQIGYEDNEQQGESSGSEHLDDTIVGKSMRDENADGATPSTTLSTVNQEHLSSETSENWSILLSTITSLKEALSDLREESSRNSKEINTIRSQMTENPALSSSLRNEQQAKTPQEAQSPITRYQNASVTSAQLQTMSGTFNRHCNWQQSMSNFNQQLPPLTRAYRPPIQQVVNTSGYSRMPLSQPTSNVQQFPSSSNVQQLTPPPHSQQLPPLLNVQEFVPTSNSHSPPSSHAQQLPPSSNTQQLMPPSNLLLPPSSNISLPSSSNLQQPPLQQFMPPSNSLLPPSSNISLPSSSNLQQIPPSSNLQQFVPTSSLHPPNMQYFSQHPDNAEQYSSNFQQMHLPSQFHATTTPTTIVSGEYSTKFYPLPQFDGKPEDWPLFLATYEETSVEFGYTHRQNLMRLQKALHGAAKNSVMSMLIFPQNVPQIIEELSFNFGRPELLVRSQLDKIKTYPAITEGRLEGVLGLATCAKNVVAFFKSARCENHLLNPTLLEQLVLKLPLSKQYEWAKHSVSVLPYPTVEHFAKWIGELAHFCSLMPQRITGNINDRQQSSAIQTRRVLHSKEEQHSQRECQLCKNNHELSECKQFGNLSTDDKWERVKQFHMCFSCLRKGHGLTQCRRRKICGVNGCSRYHHPMLHQDLSIANKNQQAEHVLQCRKNQNTSHLYKVLPVTLHGPNGALKVYALLDEGSSISLLEEQVAKSLGLKGQKSSITLQWYGNIRKTEPSMKVNIEISSSENHSRKYVMNNLHTVKELNLPVQSFDKFNFDHLEHLPIEGYKDEKPSILIGLEHSYLSLTEQVVEAGPNLPVASATKLGWVAYGPTLSTGNNIARVCHINETSAWKEIHELVMDYFSIENFGVRASNIVLESDNDKRARSILEKTCQKVDGRYETGLLWKKDQLVLPDSFEMAKKRLANVENKMKRDPVFSTNYKREINKYIDKGYARLLSPNEKKHNICEKLWYLPHFGVTNPYKPEKLRIVFDAAATASNTSLNSALLKGPEHAKPLQTILFQFRQGQIAIAGDIQEMFSQVSIIKSDQNSQRFLWRDGKSNNEIQIYVMQSMIFGAICSPCCAEYVKNINAKGFQSTMPRGAKAVINNTYVDDLVISFDNVGEALEITTEAKQINLAAGFNLRNFSSNSEEIERKLNEGCENSPTTLKMEKQKKTDKVLGLYWNKANDEFEFHVKFHKICTDVLEGKRSPTKREILGIVMAVFDPFGFLANFTIFSKLLIQRTWKLSMQWDDQLPQNILKQWNLWWKEFEKVRLFSIPRCYSALLPFAEEIQLHVFVDASSSAYAAVAYFRIKYKDDIHVSFVMAKSRCAPVRGMTIPRLELQAAILGCRLKTLIKESHNVKIDRFIFWCDSKTVLFWIQSTEREYKQFVACRIAEILSTTEPEQWKWLPSDLNVADEATRPKVSVDFECNSRWLKGPDFLKQQENFWPNIPLVSGDSQGSEEEKVNIVLVLHSVIEPIFKYEKFSKFLRLKRCAAWVLRFINTKLRKHPVVSGELTATEIEAGEKLICRLVQIEAFEPERLTLAKNGKIPKSSSIYQLSPFLDKDMLLKVNGRIDNAYCLPETARKPIIMPTKHPVTLMIIAYFHERRHHQNDNVVVNEIRQKFWVPYIRSALKLVKKTCCTCIIDAAKPIPPLMGQLPIDRITPYVRPFTYVGLDYCGPFHITIGRRREKRWIALFTCLGTRALHLEISEDLSTDAFLLCVRNFVNRRGVPVRIRSDNGTNFIGAQKEMTKENRFFDYEEIQRNLSKNNIEWIFNCPANPHAGGCWERLVKCVKQLLYKIFKEEAPRLGTFQSALIEAENIINNRPLTQLPIDPVSEEPLTPNHFLLGGLSSTQTPGPDNNICLRKQWRIAQNLKDRIWRRWVVEYLPQLLIRPKWREKAEPLKVDDIVLILDSNQPRSQWKMGRITQVFTGKDGQVRSAEVKTQSGLMRRPAVKLAVMKLAKSSS